MAFLLSSRSCAQMQMIRRDDGDTCILLATTVDATWTRDARNAYKAYCGDGAKMVLHFGHFGSLRIGLRERLPYSHLSARIPYSETVQGEHIQSTQDHLGGKRKFYVCVLELLVKLRSLVHTGSLDFLKAICHFFLLRLEL